MSEWHWIALAVYVVGFFLIPYLFGKFIPDDGFVVDDGCGIVAMALTWPVWVPLVALAWLFVGLPMMLLQLGRKGGEP